jgi:hypothetical protein
LANGLADARTRLQHWFRHHNCLQQLLLLLLLHLLELVLLLFGCWPRAH